MEEFLQKQEKKLADLSKLKDELPELLNKVREYLGEDVQKNTQELFDQLKTFIGTLTS